MFASPPKGPVLCSCTELRAKCAHPGAAWYRLCLSVLLVLSLPAVSQSQAPAPPAPAPLDTPTATTIVEVGDYGLRVSGPGYRLTVGGYVQGNGRLFWSDRTGQAHDKVLFRRIRPEADFEIGDWLLLRLMPDFAGNTVVVQDAYAEVRKSTHIRLRLGKFKAPLGLETLRPDRDSVFVERSLTSNLVPIRDLGAQVFGAYAGQRIHYAAGFFSGAVDGSNATFAWRTGYAIDLRVFLQPFLGCRNPHVRQLGVGIAGSTGQHRGTLPALKTEGQNTFFRYSASSAAAGSQTRIVPQAYYFAGPFGVLAEYAMSSQDVRRGSLTQTLTTRGWQVAGSVMITGEKNRYSGVRPKRAFEPQKGLAYLGGWELKLRYSRVDVDPAAFPIFASSGSVAGASEWVTGVNWHLHRHAKLLIDYEYGRFQRAPFVTQQPHSERALLGCLQLAF